MNTYIRKTALAILIAALVAFAPTTSSAQTSGSVLANALVEVSVSDPFGFSFPVAQTITDASGFFSAAVPTTQTLFVTVRDMNTGLIFVQVSVSPTSTTISGQVLSGDGGVTWQIDFNAQPGQTPAPAPTEPAPTDTTPTDDSGNDSQAQNTTQTQMAQDIADAAHVSLQAVIDMRNSGMGWGEIADELGVDHNAFSRGKHKGKGK